MHYQKKLMKPISNSPKTIDSRLKNLLLAIFPGTGRISKTLISRSLLSILLVDTVRLVCFTENIFVPAQLLIWSTVPWHQLLCFCSERKFFQKCLLCKCKRRSGFWRKIINFGINLTCCLQPFLAKSNSIIPSCIQD